MKIQPITNIKYNNNCQKSFKAGKIIIDRPDYLWSAGELQAIANNDEFKKLARELGDTGCDLKFVREDSFGTTSCKSVELYKSKGGFDFLIKRFHYFFNSDPDIRAFTLVDQLDDFRVEQLTLKINEVSEIELSRKRAKESALKSIDDYNNTTGNVVETDRKRLGFWSKIADIFK